MEILTQEQEQIIINEWNSRPDDPPSLIELVKLAYPDKDDVDGRSKEGKLVQGFLAKRSLKARGTHQYKPRKTPDLSPEDCVFIQNNFQTMTPLDMARVLFSNPSLTNLNSETKIIAKYISDNLNRNLPDANDEASKPNTYASPKNFERAINKINKYIYDINLKKDNLTPRQKKDIECFLKYINTYRFVHQINSYERDIDKDLFESSFIRYTYDKNDLTEEEVDQYIILSSEVVIASNIQRRVEKLQNLLEDAADNDTRISMGLVESINTAQSEYNQCVGRQQKLVNDLKTKRSDRMNNNIKHNASIINLFQAWKEEETRMKMLKLAEIKKLSLNEEIDRMETMDELKSRILGISREEILNG